MRTARRLTHFLVPLTLALALAAACGGAESAPNGATGSADAVGAETSTPATAVSSEPAVVSPDAPPPTVAPTEVAPALETVPADVEETSGGSPADGGAATGSICDSLPSLEAISAIVGEPVTSVADYSDPVIEGIEMVRSEKCEATGAGASLAIFERYDPEIATAIAAAAGAEPVTFGDRPAIANAQGVVNTVILVRDGVAWAASVFRMDWAGVTDNPAAYVAGADLLEAWLAVN